MAGPAEPGEGVEEAVVGGGVFGVDLVEGECGVCEEVEFGVEVDEGVGEGGEGGEARLDELGVDGFGVFEVFGVLVVVGAVEEFGEVEGGGGKWKACHQRMRACVIWVSKILKPHQNTLSPSLTPTCTCTPTSGKMEERQRERYRDDGEEPPTNWFGRSTTNSFGRRTAWT